jgi:hypothetical protein
VPQVAFLYGLNVAFLGAGLSGTAAAVIWAHALFVFPYVMIALSDPWRRLDRRYRRPQRRSARGRGGGSSGVKLPLLLQPILTAAAIGFAVSVAQYLPTLFIGAGRVATLTTEAVALSSGADRRIAGLYGLLQAALPWAVYTLAISLPLWLWRDRRDLRGEGRHEPRPRPPLRRAEGRAPLFPPLSLEVRRARWRPSWDRPASASPRSSTPSAGIFRMPSGPRAACFSTGGT